MYVGRCNCRRDGKVGVSENISGLAEPDDGYLRLIFTLRYNLNFDGLVQA